MPTFAAVVACLLGFHAVALAAEPVRPTTNSWVWNSDVIWLSDPIGKEPQCCGLRLPDIKEASNDCQLAAQALRADFKDPKARVHWYAPESSNHLASVAGLGKPSRTVPQRWEHGNCRVSLGWSTIAAPIKPVPVEPDLLAQWVEYLSQ